MNIYNIKKFDTLFHNINNIQPLNKNISQLIKYNKGPSWSSKECICFVQHIISKHIVLVKDQHNHHTRNATSNNLVITRARADDTGYLVVRIQEYCKNI